MSRFLIWWTNQEECEAVGEQIEQSSVPDYLKSEFRSRVGRNGRGRLWVPDHIDLKGIEWDTAKPASRLAESRGGIVLDADDSLLVFYLPGFLTDLELNFINGLDMGLEPLA